MNVQSGNSFYVDSAGTVTASSAYTSLRVYYITITTTAANGSILLQDAGTGANKVLLKVAADNTTQYFRFETQPIGFRGGITVGSISNCVATIVTSIQGG